MKKGRNVLIYIGNFCSINSDWEQNEEFFSKLKKQLIERGNFTYFNTFNRLEDFIRWKGKEDSTIHSGKSMLRNI